ncbi:MAG: ATP-binding protein [Thaumarchaeota archaeon]|nr:ATP-binding protein [Nitrososphaerota archaeon]
MKLVSGGFFETEWFDFKEQLTQNLDETASAFANARGGFFVFGIKDTKSLEPSKRIVGLDSIVDIPRLFGDRIEVADPHIHYEFMNPPIKIPNSSKVIHVIHIPASHDSPHMSGDKRFRYRTNKGNQIMTRQQVKESFLKNNRSDIQKSSHFRFALDNNIRVFMEIIAMRLYPDYENAKLNFFSDETQEKDMQRLKKFIDKSDEELYQIFLQNHMLSFEKFDEDYKDFIEELQHGERFQHDDLFPDEHNAFVALKEQVLYIRDDFSFERHYQYHPVKNINGTYEDMMNSSEDKSFFRMVLLRFIRELKILANTLFEIEKIWNEMKKEYGDIIFKTPW